MKARVFPSVVSALAVALVTTSRATIKTFRDPAPPRVAELKDAPTPAPRENPDVTFHAAPKPLPKGAVTSDWPSFLGPTHNMFSPETKLLKEFPREGLHLVWEMKKGEGFASPAIAGDRLIFFHRVGENEVVECAERESGKRLWQFSSKSDYRDRYGFNGGPRASPVIADGRVFTFGVAGRLQCLDLATGQLLWHRDLLGEFKIPQNFFGVGATPLVEGDRVIVNLGAPDGPCVAAFDAKTGRMVWGAGTEWGPSYASPIPATVNGRRRVFVFAGGESEPATGGLLSIDPANGAVDFAFPWRGDRYESVNAASPVVIGNDVFVAECYGSGGVLVEALPDGKARKRWSNPTFGMHFMTAIPKDGYIYGVDGHGPSDAEFACVDLKTGKQVWRTQPLWKEKVPSKRGTQEMTVGTLRSSLLMIDGRTLCLGEFGHLLWLDLQPDGYHELARTWLFAGTETWVPPVVSRGLLYVCQNSADTINGTTPRLRCYDLRAEEVEPK